MPDCWCDGLFATVIGKRCATRQGLTDGTPVSDHEPVRVRVGDVPAMCDLDCFLGLRLPATTGAVRGRPGGASSCRTRRRTFFLVETWQETRLDSRPRVRRNVAMSAESQLESSCSQPNAGDGVSTPGMYMAFEMLLRALFNPEILNAQIDLCPRAVI